MALTKVTGSVIKDSVSLSGNVSVGGTLTYQDVTNVDALGIGTFRAGIDITGGNLIIPDKIIHSGDTNTSLRFPSADTITAETGGTERFRISSNGLVNIGAGSSASGLSPLLHLHKNASNSSAYFHITNNDTGITNNDGFLLGVNPSGDCLVFNKDSTAMRFATAGIERLRIDAGGGLQLGTTTVTASKLTVYGANDAAAIFQGSGTGTGAGNGLLVGNNGGTTGLLWNYENGNTLFATNNIERLRISSVGNVSLGLGGDAVPTSTAYNGGTLHIHQATSGSNGAQLKMTTAAGGSAAGDGFYIAHWGGNNETFIYNKEATNMRFGTNSAERLIIKNDGDLEITDGNLIVAPGHGIDFSDSSNASGSTSELLDDFEEGSFTVAVKSVNGGTMNGSYSQQSGRYTKIGRMVHIRFDMTWSGWTNASGAIQIDNLPFTNLGTSSSGGYGSPQFRDCSGLHNDIKLYGNSSWFENNSNRIRVMAWDPNGTEYYITPNQSGRVTGEGVMYTEV